MNESGRTRDEQRTPIGVRLLGQRPPVLGAVALGGLMAAVSLGACALTYRLLGLAAEDAATAVAMFGLPVVLPLTIGSFIMFHLLRMGEALHDRTRELEVEVERRTAAERTLAILANQDELTGLANRRAFFTHAEWIATTGRSACVAVLDFDDFKQLNDTFGHAVGDGALREFGALMSEAACADGFVARLGGEEFGIIVPVDACPDITGEMERLRVQVHTIRPQLTASIGITTWEPASGESIDLALARADIGLYRAKQHGRNRVEFVDPADAIGDIGSSDLAPVARRP